jgi:uncharacterized OsmC-like protein
MTAAETAPARSAKPPTDYTITARALAEGPATAEAATSTIDLDTTWGSAPTGLPGPAELLATAFAACLLKNLARTHDLLGFNYHQADVEVTARRQDSPPRFTEITYRLQVVTDEPPRRIELAHKNLRKYGTVYNTLAAICDVHGEMLPAGPGSAAPGHGRGD